MPNIKSAIKRVELGKVRMLKNAAAKSFLRTTLRRFEESISTDSETAALALKKATRALDKASSKGLIHKNLAARKKSRLTKRLNKHFAKVG
ncbi:30S ribosomal subunit protein S20 [Candidatus Desulfosporosinus infrequens]|uniref:Small ribosomal subunit protein bS20 n=1 Tax=Candidatus Desulfosporosinus infrequens TaxID=2043169 RepID=A0A2U3K4W0_9FIRM|nr:30S ribosomal subunit protein S20 [Candidatus Desulfosporosinus infrequens]